MMVTFLVATYDIFSLNFMTISFVFTTAGSLCAGVDLSYSIVGPVLSVIVSV